MEATGQESPTGSQSPTAGARLKVKRPAPVAVPPRAPVSQIIQPPQTTDSQSPVSPDSPASPDSNDNDVVPDSPSRFIVRNTFIDIEDSDFSGSGEPGSPARPGSAPASPTGRADPWGAHAEFDTFEDPTAKGMPGRQHKVDERWIRELASPKKISRPTRKKSGQHEEGEASITRLGDLLKLGIPGQPTDAMHHDDPEALAQQMHSLAAQQELLRSRFASFDYENGPRSRLASENYAGLRGQLPGVGLEAGLPGSTGLGAELEGQLQLGGQIPGLLPGAFAGNLPGSLPGALPGALPGSPFVGDAGSRIPPHQDAGSRIPPQQAFLPNPLDPTGCGMNLQSLQQLQAQQAFLPGGLITAGGMLLAQGLSALQQQQAHLQQQQEQLERLRMTLGGQQGMLLPQDPFNPYAGYAADMGKGGRQSRKGSKVTTAGPKGGKRGEEDAGRKMDKGGAPAGLDDGKEKNKVPLSGGGPKRTDYIKKFGTSEPAEGSVPKTQPITTMMLKNIPCRKAQEEVMAIIDEEGFKGLYDFFYLPRDVKFRANLGYAFINFVTPEDAAAFQNKMDGYQFPNSGSAKACIVVPAHVQGAVNNLQAFKRTEVMRSNRKPYFSNVVAL